MRSSPPITMAPSVGGTRRWKAKVVKKPRTTAAATKPRRSCDYMKKRALAKPKDMPEVASSFILEEDHLPSISSIVTTSSTTNITGLDMDGLGAGGGLESEAALVISSSSACSTPKGQKSRIPEIVTCPPAPKKKRVVSNCSLQRRPIAFFAPPDLEMFFFFALRDISV